LITLALLNVSSARTPASSPVVRCFTHTPAFPGNRAISASSIRWRPDAGRGAGCCAVVAVAVISQAATANTGDNDRK
jgi:hypothetical protein